MTEFILAFLELTLSISESNRKNPIGHSYKAKDFSWLYVELKNIYDFFCLVFSILLL